MNLVRKYKISKLLDKKADGIEGEYIAFIIDFINGISAFKYKDYEETYYIDNNNKTLFYHHENFIYINYGYFRKMLEDRFEIDLGYKYDDVNKIFLFDTLTKFLRFCIRRILKVKYRYSVNTIENETNDIDSIEKAFANRDELSKEV